MLQPCSSSNSSSSSSSSFLFPMSAGSMDEPASYYYSSSTSVVDCTLSLGTPSSRHPGAAGPPMNRPMYGSSPSFCWDIITQSKTQQQAAAASRVPSASSFGNSNSSSSNMGGGDPLLLARRCANCDTTSTPLWRNGPRGPKSLCNACGIRYKKEERRAAASTAPPSLNEPIGYTTYQRQQQQQHKHPWNCYPSAGTSSKSTAGMSWCQSDEDMEASPYLSWRLSTVVPHFPVTDRPSLFQYQ